MDLTETSTAAMDDLSSGAPTADWTSATKAAAPPPGPWRRLRCDGGWGVVTASTGNREIGGAPAASPKGSAGAAGPPPSLPRLPRPRAPPRRRSSQILAARQPRASSSSSPPPLLRSN